MVFTGMILMLAVVNLYAFKWAAGYNNGVSARVWWNDDFGSEAALGGYATFALSQQKYMYFDMDSTFYFTPVICKVFKSQYVDIHASIKYTNSFEYRYWQSANGYDLSIRGESLSVILPSVEIRMPFLENLSLTCDFFGLYYSWPSGDLFRKGDVSIAAFSISSVGIFYYF